MRIRDTLSAEFSRLCYYGFWYAPEMELVMNSIDFSQRHVTGAVEIKLYKGNTIVMGRESPVALYRYVIYYVVQYLTVKGHVQLGDNVCVTALGRYPRTFTF